MDKVRMTHPDLPDQPIDVLPLAVAQHEKSGWKADSDSAVVDSGARQVAAQPGTAQQPVSAGKPATTAGQKPGKDGSDA